MMDHHIVEQIEKVLEYPQTISQQDVFKKLQQLEVLFQKLYPKFPEFSMNEKGVFLRLLTKTNELLRIGMDYQMKNLNLSPEKLKAIFEKASHSKDPESQALTQMLGDLKRRADEVQASVNRLNAQTNQATSQKKHSSAQQQRLIRGSKLKDR